MKNFVSKRIAALLILAFLRAIVDIFEDTYISTQLARITGNMLYISVYYIAKYVACAMFAIILGRYVKKYRLIVFRLGILFDIIYLVAFASIALNGIVPIIIVGMLHGISIIGYYLPLSVITSDAIMQEERHVFLSAQNIMIKVIAMVTPITIGAMITKVSFSFTIKTIVLMAVVQLGATLLLNQGAVDVKSSYSLTNFLKENWKDKTLKNVLLFNVLRGASLTGIQMQLINIIILFAFKSEFALGKISSVIAVASIATVAIFAKVSNEERYGKTAICVSVGYIVTVILFAVCPYNTTLILVKFAYEIMTSILSVIVSNYYYKVAAEGKSKDELFVFQQFWLNIGKIISWILIGITASSVNASIALVTMNIALIWLVFIVSKEFKKV